MDLIEPENWMAMDADIKGDIYEGLLSRSAEESPKGAGQYFTPRALIQAVVDVMRPAPDDTVCDPACGTGGFLLAAHSYVSQHFGARLDPDQKRHLRMGFVNGWELVPATGRLAVMNILLHGVNADPCPIHSGVDSLAKDPAEKFSVVLTNPPFGKKSSFSIVNEDGNLEKEEHTYERSGFWATTKNKQLNFLQHVTTLLKVNGRCAIVVPDNVLFEGGAGETIRRELLRQFEVHTLLRLPTGIFYAQGVKANVLFFDAKPASAEPWTRALWVYDLRTNKRFTLKTNPLRREHLDGFVGGYFGIGGEEVAAMRNPAGPIRPPLLTRIAREATWSADNPQGRWRCFEYAELVKRDKVNLDIFWLKDDSLEDADSLPEPDELAKEIADDLLAAFEQFNAIAAGLEA
ncbi:MAG: class I SAM-dependent DNA methyltransferase [Candidatus Methylumidiphilus sp.]